MFDIEQKKQRLIRELSGIELTKESICLVDSYNAAQKTYELIFFKSPWTITFNYEIFEGSPPEGDLLREKVEICYFIPGPDLALDKKSWAWLHCVDFNMRNRAAENFLKVAHKIALSAQEDLPTFMGFDPFFDKAVECFLKGV